MPNLRSGVFIVKQYLQYWLNAIDQYSLHSPFVYRFYNEVIAESPITSRFTEIEALRQSLLKNHTTLHVQDLGAGSLALPESTRRISKIADTSLSTPKFSRFLYRLLRYFNPVNVLDLGTSLGINTAYMARATPSSPIYTLEGCPNIANLARDHFNQLQLENIRLIEGNIDETLPNVLQEMGSSDFVFFDANHTETATLHYFELCLHYKSEHSIFVFDDIHLSKEMNNAWEQIREHHDVRLTIDIFDAGIVFFEKGMQSGHYRLSF